MATSNISVIVQARGDFLSITAYEKEVFEFIKKSGETQVSNLPKMMWGAIPNLKNANLVKTYKKTIIPWATKKHTFVEAILK